MLLQGSFMEIMPVLVTAIVGVTLVSGALQGYLIGFGLLGEGAGGLLARALLVVAGLVFAIPGGGILGLNQWLLALSGCLIAICALGLSVLLRRRHALA
jgi:hypothetical protein